MAESVDTSHWTHRLFVKRRELFLPFLEKAEDRVEAEIAVLTRLLGEACRPEGGFWTQPAESVATHCRWRDADTASPAST